MERAADDLETAGKQPGTAAAPDTAGAPDTAAAPVAGPATTLDVTLADTDRRRSGRAGHHDPDDDP
jgi:hypothetical protein